MIDFDKLHEKNLFVYLSTNKKFDERHISYDSFKGFSPKNSQHRKFNDFLIKNRKYISEYTKSELKSIAVVWKKRAIEYFNIAAQIIQYEKEKIIVDQIMNLFNKSDYITLKNHTKFTFFIRYWGVNSIKDWDQNKFDSEWQKFTQENWGNLRHF